MRQGREVKAELSNIRRVATFQSPGHGDGDLDDDKAAEWMYASFGHSHLDLADAKLVAASALVSRDSVRRSQLVLAHSLQCRTAEVHVRKQTNDQNTNKQKQRSCGKC